MKIELYPSGIFRILKINDMSTVSTLDELCLLIDEYLSQNETHIALSFPETTYMFSGAVASLVSCIKKIRDNKGELCIIEPNPEMVELFKQMGIDKILSIYQSESELPSEFAR